MTSGKSLPKAGQMDLINQCLTYEWKTILDVGAGTGWVSEKFIASGRSASATFLSGENVHPGIKDYGRLPIGRMDSIPDESLDAVWAAHVLEHTHDTGLALKEIRRVLRPNGYLFLSVPPFKHEFAAGHVNIGWNLVLLAYVLAVHGFDAREGAFVRHGYNLAAFVAKSGVPNVELHYDRHDLARMQPYLPRNFPIRHGQSGDVRNINWTWNVPVGYRDTPLRSVVRQVLRPLRRAIRTHRDALDSCS